MDGRKSNGGVRKGAGRPKKVEEEKLIEKLNKIRAKTKYSWER